jgi:hypothetical protein
VSEDGYTVSKKEYCNQPFRKKGKNRRDLNKHTENTNVMLKNFVEI